MVLLVSSSINDCGQVTDTPGVCDTHRSLEEIHREICKSVATVVPGPHAILMCFRCDQRFTDEEYQAYVQLKKLFGEHMKKHMIVIFNGLDEAKPPNIDELGKNIKQLGFVLGDLKSPDRHVLLNNEARGRRRDEQADQVLDVVTQVFLDNDRRYFTDDIMEEFEKQMMKKEREGMTREMVQEAVLKNDKNVAKAFENALTEEEVRKRGRCAIL